MPFNCPRVPFIKRIGPHNYDILTIIIGSLLGDGTMEKDGNGSRFAFYQEKVNGEMQKTAGLPSGETVTALATPGVRHESPGVAPARRG